MIRSPPVSTVTTNERADAARSLRVALSRAIGGCAEFARLAGGRGAHGGPPPALAPAQALRCAHEAIEAVVRALVRANRNGEAIAANDVAADERLWGVGARPPGGGEAGELFGADLADALRAALLSRLPPDDALARLRVRLGRHCREWDAAERLRDEAESRLEAAAAEELRAMCDACGVGERDRAARAVRVLALSDSAQMPCHLGANDHNPALNFLYVAPHWAWVVLGHARHC